MKKAKKVLIGILLIFVVLAGCFFFYVNDYYRADIGVKDYLTSAENVAVTEISEGYFFDGKDDTTAIIFYPGGKVAYEAYVPLLYGLAQQGFDCFLIKMPCNLAIFGKDKADAIINQYDYDNWYMMGHSLGGAFGAVYASENPEKLTGLCMLAAYPTSKIDDSLKVLTIYGSNDQVVNHEKLDAGKEYVSKEASYICIEGGNHAMYGNYGEQKGDGKAEISTKEQQEETITAITSWINK